MAKVTLTCGLSFGDEGKGTIVDSLARRESTRLVVRYNGGAQAAHNVVDGERHHTFAQFGSGTFVGVPTLLSRFVLVNPIFALAEALHLKTLGVMDPLSMLYVERGATVTTPFHVAMNRLREMARDARHGSCGMGIGETMQDVVAGEDDVIRIADLESPALLLRRLENVRTRKLEDARALGLVERSLVHAGMAREIGILSDSGLTGLVLERYLAFAARANLVGSEMLARELSRDGHLVFEGAQGVLLDQDMGFAPYTTWTDITFRNAEALLADSAHEASSVTKLGILRAYTTRHGAGPMVTASPDWDVISAHDHNRWGEWQGEFRSGPLDLVATRYALDVLAGVDGIALTNLDRLAPFGDEVPVCSSYGVGGDSLRASELETDSLRTVKPSLFSEGGAILVRRPFDLEHQTRLGRALQEVRPELSLVSRAHYAHEIGERLRTAILALGFGPRASDKQWQSPR